MQEEVDQVAKEVFYFIVASATKRNYIVGNIRLEEKDLHRELLHYLGKIGLQHFNNRFSRAEFELDTDIKEVLLVLLRNFHFRQINDFRLLLVPY